MEVRTDENLMFPNDELARSVWKSKYAQENETHYDQMHRRMAREFARVDKGYQSTTELVLPDNLSKYGNNRVALTEDSIYDLFKDFKYIVPQGSIMSQLGSDSIGSLSNCFVIGQPVDSYGGIFQKDQQLAQLMKRRGGVGIDISTLRPEGVATTNAAKTSTGAVSFMHRFSNTTREVAQNGRRGALMLSIDINHPDSLAFIKAKRDRTSITGANISIKLNDKFMKAVENDEDYLLKFPTYITYTVDQFKKEPYNELITIDGGPDIGIDGYVKKVKAKEYWNEIIKSATHYAEPGIIFVDNHWNYSPDGIYEQYKGVTTNPCFHPNTLIETEYGRIAIKDINKPMRVYSMDSDGRLVMSNASASFISKKDAQTYKIVLRNGNSIRVTEDHKMYVHNRGWVEVKDIKFGDRIAHLCRSRRGAKYSGVHLTTSPNGQRDQVMEHKLVYGPHEASFNVHHLDRNTYNNSIENLELLSHSEHSRITALEDNPQNHQVRDELGKFISGETSGKGEKIIVDLPEELKTNVLSRFHNSVISVEKDEVTDVYDIQVEDTHCLIANNMVAHNCGEIFMQPYDACRLLALNFYSFIKNPFTPEAEFDFELFYKITYEAMRLSDDLVDLELESIDKILDKIAVDPESPEIKIEENNLWLKIKETTQASRRTGLGFTGLGDMIAAMNLSYTSNESLELVDRVMYTKMRAELDCTIDLAILRGTFKGWDVDKEYPVDEDKNSESYGQYTWNTNDFYLFIADTYEEQFERMIKYGRRNVSFSTVAPTGSVSLLTQTTSGIEPLYKPFYTRRKKVLNSSNKIDFTDENGDNWQEFTVLHPKFKEWLTIYTEKTGETWYEDESILEEFFKKSPWYNSIAEEINWRDRIEMQSIIQRYTSHSISSTINLPKETTEEEVSHIYMAAWQNNLKGITVYVDGSRDGVLVDKTTSRENFSYIDATKRPKKLKCEVFLSKIKGQTMNIYVGLLNNKPYEVFIDVNSNIPSGAKGWLVKKARGKYEFLMSEASSEGWLVTENMTDEQIAITRLVSTSLRHGADIKFIVEQLLKTNGDLFSFTKGLARVLKKYIEEGAVSTTTCDNCGSTNVVFQEGCLTCLNCGNSKCG